MMTDRKGTACGALLTANRERWEVHRKTYSREYAEGSSSGTFPGFPDWEGARRVSRSREVPLTTSRATGGIPHSSPGPWLREQQAPEGQPEG